MTEDVVWTRAQQDNALRVIEVVRSSVHTDIPILNVIAATGSVIDLVPGGIDATDAQFAEVAPDLLTALVNVAGTFAEHYARAAGISAEQAVDNVVAAIQSVTIVD